jgi:hypothetical protein
MRSRVTLAIPWRITSLALYGREIVTWDIHSSAKLVKSIGNIECCHVIFSEI